MFQKPRIIGFFALVLVLAFSQGLAQAQVVKPFKITGGGPVRDGLSLIPGVPAIHEATGQATELGRYSCEGMFTLLALAPPPGATAAFSSAPYCIFTAANGDVLTCSYGVVDNGADGPGVVTLSPAGPGLFTAVFVAEFNPVPELCTGRFAKVTGGSWLMIAQSAPFAIVGTQTTPFTYTWEGKGSLTFAEGK